jgi:kumamolisin
VSDFFSLPDYQNNIGVPESVNPSPPFMARGRGIPDVAANASPNSAYPMYFCGFPYYAAGTSAATPLWAGLIARINSYRGPFSVGWVHPLLYAWALSQVPMFNPLNPLWRDPHNPHLAACPTNNGFNGVKGYHATSGWDACTGWGSPNGKALVDQFMFLFGAV